MGLSEKEINFLQNLEKNHVHGKNMLAKSKSEKISDFYEPYSEFLNDILHKKLIDTVQALNKYKNFVHTNSEYSAQSKFEPTILEEFLNTILKKKFGNEILQYGSINAYSSMYFSYANKQEFKEGVNLKLNVKNQDVSIFKKEILQIGDKKKEIYGNYIL